MLIIYLFLITILTFWGISISKDDDYLSKERCNSIKGIFILLIFLTHSFQYIRASGYDFSGIDALTLYVIRYIGQLVVVMFLFYSGYGVAIQIKSRGKEYITQIPHRRILKTLLNFDVAVCIFIILDLFIAHPLSISQVLLSFVAWDSVGNSNWYIFIIILCYLFTYVANIVSRRYVCSLVLLLCVVSVILLSFIKESWWYDTILVYPVGYFYAYYRNQLEPILKRYYYLILAVIICIFVFTHSHGPFIRGLKPNIMAIAFAAIIVMVTMRIKIGNPLLQWFGINLFPLYIYQRLPMITLKSYLGDGFVSNNALLYLMVCLLITCVITRYYSYWKL